MLHNSIFEERIIKKKMTEYFIFNSYSSLCRKTVKPSFQPPYRGTIGYMRNLA